MTDASMLTTYQGSCHCGAVRFEIDAQLDHVRVCDCSLCRKRGALNHRVQESPFRLLTPLEEMVEYRGHTMTSPDYVCPTRVILPIRRPRSAPACPPSAGPSSREATRLARPIRPASSPSMTRLV